MEEDEEEKKEGISEVSESEEYHSLIQEYTKDLPSSIFPNVLRVILFYANIQNNELQKRISSINETLLILVFNTTKREEDLKFIIAVLKSKFKKQNAKAKEIAIKWFTNLFNKYSDRILWEDEETLPAIIESINFKERKLTKNILSLLSLMSQKNDSFFKQIIQKLLIKLSQDQ